MSRLARNADPAGDPAQTGNGRLNLARAMADGGSDQIQPAGAAPVGDGGPLVGPYDASAGAFDVTPLTQTVAAGSTNNYSWLFDATNSANNATTTFTVPAGWTAPTTAAGAGNVTVVAGSCPASLLSVVGMVITIDQGPGSNTCTNPVLETFTLNYNQATAPAGPIPTTYTFVNQHGQDPQVTIDRFYFSNVAPSGNWNVAANWQNCTDTAGTLGCVTATASPTNANSALIVVRSGDTINVSANVTADQLVVRSGGQLTVDATRTLTIGVGFNNADVDLTVDSGGTLNVVGTVQASSVGGNFPVMEINGNASVSGLFNLTGASAASRPSLTIASGASATVTGDITASLGVIALNGAISVNGVGASITGGNLSELTVVGSLPTDVTSVSSVGGIALGGGTGSVLIVSTGGTLALTGSATFTSGTNANDFLVAGGGSLKLAPAAIVTGMGAFNLQSGGSIAIGSAAGISSSGATGSIQMTGTRSFDIAADYTYDGTASQITGNGLPLTVNNLTIANTAAAVTPTNNVRTDGTLSVLAGATLQKIGAFTLTVGVGGVSNAGTIQLNGTGAGCPEADNSLLRSTVPGVQRPWSGAGTFNLTDVNVQDQAGTAVITVLSGTPIPAALGNNGANWVIVAGCVLDATAPTVTLSGGGSGTTNIATFGVTAQFSETVIGFTAGDVDTSANATVSNFVAVDGDTYTFDVTATPMARSRSTCRRHRGRCGAQPEHRVEPAELDLRRYGADRDADGWRLGTTNVGDLRRDGAVQRDGDRLHGRRRGGEQRHGQQLRGRRWRHLHVRRDGDSDGTVTVDVPAAARSMRQRTRTRPRTS